MYQDRPENEHEDSIHKLRVRHGFVDCPLRGRTDVEVCFYCDALMEVDLDTPNRHIVCHSRRTAAALRLVQSWLTLFELADIRRNVSEACREMKVPRRSYYTHRRAYEDGGVPALLRTIRRSKVRIDDRLL